MLSASYYCALVQLSIIISVFLKVSAPARSQYLFLAVSVLFFSVSYGLSTNSRGYIPCSQSQYCSSCSKVYGSCPHSRQAYSGCLLQLFHQQIFLYILILQLHQLDPATTCSAASSSTDPCPKVFQVLVQIQPCTATTPQCIVSFSSSTPQICSLVSELAVASKVSLGPSYLAHSVGLIVWLVLAVISVSSCLALAIPEQLCCVTGYRCLPVLLCLPVADFCVCCSLSPQQTHQQGSVLSSATLSNLASVLC